MCGKTGDLVLRERKVMTGGCVSWQNPGLKSPFIILILETPHFSPPSYLVTKGSKAPGMGAFRD